MTINEGVNDGVVNAEAPEGAAVGDEIKKNTEEMAKLAAAGIKTKAGEILSSPNEAGGNTEDVDRQIAAVIKKATEMIEAVEGGEEGQVTGEKVIKDALEHFNGDKEAMMRHFEDLAQKYSTVIPVGDSVVRIEQQNQILKDLDAGPVVVEAYWRQGKSSMLKSLGNEWMEKNDSEPIFIDASIMKGQYDKLSAEEFINTFGKRQIKRFVNDNFPEIGPDELEKAFSEKAPIEALDAIMENSDKKVLLQIDELMAVAQKDDDRFEIFTQKLKNLKNVKVLLAWHPLDTLSAKADPAFEGYKRTPIKPLSFEDAKTLIERPIKDLGSDVSFSDEAIQRIYDYTGGRPLDMNLFCGQLTGGANYDSVKSMRYDKKDIEDFINKNNLNDSYSANEGFKATTINMPDLYDHFLNKEHKDTIAAIVAAGGEVPVSGITEKNATELIDLGLVRRDDKNNTYKINGDLAYNIFKEKVEQSS